jgi:hypothetical protein
MDSNNTPLVLGNNTLRISSTSLDDINLLKDNLLDRFVDQSQTAWMSFYTDPKYHQLR